MAVCAHRDYLLINRHAVVPRVLHNAFDDVTLLLIIMYIRRYV